MSTTKFERNVGFIIIVITLIILIPFILLSGYVFPVNDDYTFAHVHSSLNCFESVVDCWKTWSGRYLATFISSINPIICAPESYLTGYRLCSLITVIIFFVTLIISPFIACRKILGYKSLFLGCFGVLVFFALTDNVSQLFYWFSSITAYTIPTLLSILCLSMIPIRGRLVGVLLSILALLIPGGNEVTAILFTCTLAYLAYTHRQKRIMVMFLLAGIGVIIVLLSPGNSVRMTHQLSSNPYLWTLVASILQTLSWFVLWIPMLLVATVVYIPLFGMELTKSRIFQVPIKPFMVFALTTVFLAHIPPTLGLSSVLIDRTANCLLIYFIGIYFYGVTIVLANSKSHVVVNQGKLKYFIYLALFTFVFVGPLRFQGIVTTGYLDLLAGKAQNYKDTQESRIEIAKGAEGSNPIALPGYGITSQCLFVKDLENDPNAEFATEFSEFYGDGAPLYVPADSYYFENNKEALKHLGKRVR